MLTPKQKIILFILLILSAAVAAKLFQIDYLVNYSGMPYKSFCNINSTFNCDLVAASEYSNLWGVPIAFYGALGDILLLVFMFVAGRVSYLRTSLSSIFFTVFLFKTLGGLTLAVISFLFLPSHCVLCMAYWLLTFSGFGYLALIQTRTSRGGARFIPEVLHAVWTAKWIVTVFFAVYAVGILYTRHFLHERVCRLRDPDSRQCHNYEAATDTPFLGSEAGKLEVYTYTDFECPWCSRAHVAVAELAKKYEKQVRLIRRDFPLDMSCNPIVTQPFHTWACRAAYFARCAGRQGKYWPYHDELYLSQRALSEETFNNIAVLLGLDLNALPSCVASKEIHNTVLSDIEEGLSFGVKATPTFRIFGELFTGVLMEDALKDYLSFYPAIQPSVLRRIYNGGFEKNLVIVDIRSEADFVRAHLPGAVNFPLVRLRQKSNVLPRTRPLLLYDQNSSQSGEAFELLAQNGYRGMHTLAGGYEAWQKGGDNN